MEEKLDRTLAGQTGMGESARNPTPKKYVMGTTYWKAYGKHIWDQRGYCWIHVYCVNPGNNITTCQQLGRRPVHKDKATHKDNMRSLSLGNPKI